MKTTTKPVKRAAARKSEKIFSDDERKAMKEYVEEKKSAGRGKGTREDGAHEVLAKIAEMPEPDRSLAERIHAIVTATAPDLWPRTWYGMPAYAKNDKVICFFQNASKFKARYATLGFSDSARLDDGNMWPSAFALTRLTPADEKKIAALVKKAVG